MSDHTTLDKVTADEAFEHRGGILYLKDTHGTRRWIRLLQHNGLPDEGQRQVIVLTGRQNRRLEDLGMCQPSEARGKEFYSIFLDDPHPKEVASVCDDLQRFLKRTFSKRFAKNVWDAFLTQIYLHELGHVRHCMSNGWSGADARHEEWGFFEELDGLSTYHLTREPGMRGVHTDRFLWDGGQIHEMGTA